MVSVAGRKVSPERERVLLELIGSGMTPNRAAGIAGVSLAYAYGLDRKVYGVPRLAAKREAAAQRERAVADLIASGMTPNRAARVAGVPAWRAHALNRKMGGVYRPPSVT